MWEGGDTLGEGQQPAQGPSAVVADVGFGSGAVSPWMGSALSPGCTGDSLLAFGSAGEEASARAPSLGLTKGREIRGTPDTPSHPLPFNEYSEPSQHPGKVSATTPVLQVGRLNLREGPGLELGLRARNRLSWDLNPDCLTPNPTSCLLQ